MTTLETIVDTSVDTSTETNVETVVDHKKQARLTQLASARESAKSKKREREQDMSDIKSQLSTLASALQNQKQETKLETVVAGAPTDEEPPKKRVRVTKEPIIDEEDASTAAKQESWSTMLMRSSALFGLGIGSWYFQHRFQRPSEVKQSTKTSHKMLPPLHRAVAGPPTKTIGKSGFFM